MLKLMHSTLVVAFMLMMLLFGVRSVDAVDESSQRLVVVGGALTEIVFHLGVGDRIVGVVDGGCRRVCGIGVFFFRVRHPPTPERNRHRQDAAAHSACLKRPPPVRASCITSHRGFINSPLTACAEAGHWPAIGPPTRR